MASLSRPQSSAAVRSPPQGYPTSPLKYANSSHYSNPQSQLHADPTAAFANESRKFLSSRKGERSYSSNVEIERDPGRYRSGSYSASNNGAASPEPYHYPRGLPPTIPDRMHTPGGGRSQQQLYAAEMGRSTTAVPRPHRTHDEKGIYPTHMLPSSPTPIRAERSTMAPFSSYEDPYASHHSYRSPLHSPPPSSNDSTTSANSAGSPPPSLPQSPTRQARNVHNGSHVYGHAHGRHHSLSTNVYPVTDYASTSGAKLLPRQPTKRHTQQYTSSHSGLGAVGPALAQNIPPVLPRPPSLKGSSLSSQGLGRSGSLGRNGTIRKGDVKTITDEEQAAYAALNTYR